MNEELKQIIIFPKEKQENKISQRLDDDQPLYKKTKFIIDQVIKKNRVHSIELEIQGSEYISQDISSIKNT